MPDFARDEAKTLPFYSPPVIPAETGKSLGSSPGVLKFRVADTFHVAGRGTVVAGTVENGQVTVGISVRVTRNGVPTLSATVVGILLKKTEVGAAKAGDAVGLVLRDIARDAILRGDTISGT